MAVTVRPLREADYPAVVWMFRQAFSDGDPDASPDHPEIEARARFEVDRIAAVRGAVLLVAEGADRAILGMVTVRPGPPPACEPGEVIAMRGCGPGMATIESLWVEPVHRRRGHAGQLLSSALILARAQGLKTLCVAFEGANTPAAILYERLGFCRAHA